MQGLNLVGGQLCDMAYIVPMHVKPKFTYLLTCMQGQYKNVEIWLLRTSIIESMVCVYIIIS